MSERGSSGPIENLNRRLADAFVGGARRAPAELRRLATEGPARNLLAGQVLAGMAREFDRERGAGIEAVVRWEIGAEGEQPAVWNLLISDGRCRVGRDPETEAQTVFVLDHATLFELATGELNPPQAYIAGRLRMRGDVMLAQRLSTLFRIPGRRPQER